MNHVKKVDDTFLVCNDNHLNNLFVYDHDTPNEIYVMLWEWVL